MTGAAMAVGDARERVSPDKAVIIQVLWPPGRLLHSAQMLDAAHSHRDVVNPALDGVWSELAIGIVGLDPAEPLDYIQAAEVGKQAEVASHFQIGRTCRVGRHLCCREVAGVQDPRVEIAQHLCELLEVILVGAWDDVEVLGHADEAVRVRRAWRNASEKRLANLLSATASSRL